MGQFLLPIAGSCRIWVSALDGLLMAGSIRIWVSKDGLRAGSFRIWAKDSYYLGSYNLS